MSAEQNQAKGRMKVVIFGAEQLASLAWYVLTHDSPHEVVGFTVDAAWCHTSTLHDLPVVPFEHLEQYFPPKVAASCATAAMSPTMPLSATMFSSRHIA